MAATTLVQCGQFSDAEDDHGVTTTNTTPADRRQNDPVLESQIREEKNVSENTYKKEPPVKMEEEYYYDEDSYDSEDNEEEDLWTSNKRNHNNNNKNDVRVVHKNASNKQKTSLQPQEKQFGKFVGKIKLEKYEGPALGNRAHNQVSEISKKQHSQTYRVKDRKDRATVEQVLDPRTKMILFKLLNKGVITEINGCISTGKEANVYHASTPSGEDRALKIYKTSILVFKDRDKYVSGEFRFRHGYCKGNPRKMVKTWAEKEMRNLARLHSAGIPCPEPIILRSHVLVMEFIGDNGFPASLLKDANISDSKARELYLQCVCILRNLYWKAKLVHADLSEFNILYNAASDEMFIIDVSQSVEHDHPCAFTFLRKDCTNINAFFRKHNVAVMTVKELFEFVTDPVIKDEDIESYLEHAQKVASTRTEEELSQKDLIDEEVFKNAYIPQRLDEVIDYERDLEKAKDGDTENIYYANVTGMNKELSGAKKGVHFADQDSGSGSEDSGTDDGESTDDEDDTAEPETEQCEESNKSKKELRKENKKAVKEENREKRKEKMPKHVKKRKERTSKGNKKKH
ncbi:serine/threonine-protein kinase RIO1-like isoform X1 [Clytia hemisphaerica]|uniref:serine/threonine-protein kinase RIO1-like isoform X1 n=2 Tax=Clytia hemisphaerica TaxID=252671 RepID=UPI0034D492FF|eukprot:TCONS_00022864-protein